MRSLIRAVAVLAVATAGTVTMPSIVAADGSHDPVDERDDTPEISERDLAVLQAEAARQLAALPPPPAIARLTVPAIDDFVYDDLVVEGYAREVCNGSLRRGAAWAFTELTSRFGGTAGTMYYCRERWDVATNPDCDGQLVDPLRTPNFFSTCWSNHAQGRAIDIMVGRQGSGYNTARGTAIVNWLLASDSAGNQNAKARQLGVQQILFNDRCWNSDGDRGISSLSQMRKCGIGHFDHVHLDFTIRGAEGLTSYWGGTPEIGPKYDGLYLNDRDDGTWFVQKWFNFRAGTSMSGKWASGVKTTVPGDYDGDGVDDELFVYNGTTGGWTLRSFNGTSQTALAMGQTSNTWDQIVSCDCDRDGWRDDMILLDVDRGYLEVWNWTASGPTVRGSRTWETRWDTLLAVDWNANGVFSETLVVDRETGDWFMYSWSGTHPNQLDTGRWRNVWDHFVVGDFDSQGEVNDVWVRDAATGDWSIVTWHGGHGYTRASGKASTTWDHFVAGDLDWDGHLDEIWARDARAGGWVVWSWHRYSPRVAVSSKWLTRWDSFSVGVMG